LLAVFAAATVASTAGMAALSMKMSLTALHSGDGGGCEQCPDTDGKATPCDGVCVAPALATAPESGVTTPRHATRHGLPIVRGLDGRFGPPEPHPPRPLTLI
jgi:hypothetical protein